MKKAVRSQQRAASQRPVFDEQQWTARTLRIAWMLAVDLKVEPDALLHLEPGLIVDAFHRVAREAGQSGSADVDLRAVEDVLDGRHGGPQPNALWVSWMRTVNTHRVRTLTTALAQATGVTVSAGGDDAVDVPNSIAEPNQASAAAMQQISELLFSGIRTASQEPPSRRPPPTRGERPQKKAAAKRTSTSRARPKPKKK